MRQLAGEIPRAFRSHKNPEGAAYGRYGRAWAVRFGGRLPEDVRPLVRLAGWLGASALNGEMRGFCVNDEGGSCRSARPEPT